MINLLHGDCLELLPGIPDKSIDLIICDPPYNIGKDVWDKVENYISWLGKCILQAQRVLKDTGSFYLFHNNFLTMVEIQNWINSNSELIFKQLIVWNKKFDNSWNQLNALVSAEGLRNYSKQAEYILFYTFQDETGLSKVMLDVENFKPLRYYFRLVQEKIGLPKKSIIDRIGQCADHCFRANSTQWDLPTEKTYQELISVFKINEFDFFREYESLRQEYESLRQEYESLRYTFNNQKTHHSVWNYEIAKNAGHSTTKPVPLLENIILHSSNEGETVLDFTMGSGSTGVACLNTGRNFIGIEKDDKYFEIASRRINAHIITS